MVWEPEEKTVVVEEGTKIKAKCTVDLEELYMELYRWFEHYGYEWKELSYRNLENPDGSRQIEIKWMGTKKIDDYISFEILLQLQTLGPTDVEVTRGDAKVKMQKGTIEFRAGAWLRKNIKVWENKFMGRFFQKLYDKILAKKRHEDLEDELTKEANRLFAEIKAYLSYYPL